MRTIEGTVEHFKAGLDAWLLTVPDGPIVPGCPRAAPNSISVGPDSSRPSPAHPYQAGLNKEIRDLHFF